ncbi:MAG: DUF4149 domain-containing protein [Pyrinomonadaceae bacterium]|nr:DUF4149 domain-containing protein [Pyrinomonadaceae bacterium]
MNWLLDFRILLLGWWLGAACFFSFAVAPSAFAVLPSRELAGSVVNRTLAIINYGGIIIGLILLASSYVSQQNVNRIKLRLEQGLLLLLTAACAFGQFVIAVKLSDLRRQIGRPVEELAVDNSMRVAFNDLHGYSVTILLTAMIAALIAFFVIVRRAKNYGQQSL